MAILDALLHTRVQLNGADAPIERGIVNFVGAGTMVDDPVRERTDLTIAGSGGGVGLMLMMQQGNFIP